MCRYVRQQWKHPIRLLQLILIGRIARGGTISNHGNGSVPVNVKSVPVQWQSQNERDDGGPSTSEAAEAAEDALREHHSSGPGVRLQPREPVSGPRDSRNSDAWVNTLETRFETVKDKKMYLYV